MTFANLTEYQKGKTFVFFVRHGNYNNEIKLNHRIPGVGLNFLGKKQAKEVAEKFFKFKDEVDVLYSSNMARAIETAKEIGKKINKKIIICEGISEFNKFVWTKKIYHKNFWKHYKLYRISLKKFNEIILKHKEEVVIIVAHGNVIKGIIGNKLGLGMKNIGKLWHDNCAVTFARFNGKKLDYINYFNNRGKLR